MTFPEIDTCLLVDALHLEGHGKMTLLGFYGVAPHAVVMMNDLALPLSISFVFIGHGGTAGTHAVVFDLVDTSSNTLVMASVRGSVSVEAGNNTILGFQVNARLHAGVYVARVSAEGRMQFDGRFQVRQGPIPP
jgi:hypothetical protein